MYTVNVCELKNYEDVLKQVAPGQPVYLTMDGHGVYSIHDMVDEESFQEAEAMIQLFCDLNAGLRSAENEGWISEDDFRKLLKYRRNNRL